jgi:hypothetical protein
MKIHMSLSGIYDTIKNLEGANIALTTDVKTSLIDSTNEIRNRAKDILEDNLRRGKSKISGARSGYEYSTGKLGENIKSEIVTDEKTVTGTRVGVDLRSVRYAEWVEIGHRKMQWHSKRNLDEFVGSGDWWEGYHYLESAYLEVGPTIIPKIKDTVRETFRFYSFKGGRTRNVQTGRYSRGSNYITVS